MANLTATLAVPTYRRERVLVDTLEQALALDPRPLEILVVDQTEEHDPETVAELERLASARAIRWIRHSPPSLPGARNRALREAQGDVVIFIDDDVELPRGYVGAHLANYTEPAVAGVAGRTIQAKGGWQVRPAPAGVVRELEYLHLDLAATERREDVANWVGCNHSVRRADMLALGGYDENFIGWAYREDTDAAIRVARSGRRIVFDPQASLLHLAAPAGGCRIKVSPAAQAEWQVSYPAAYFTWRHLMRTRVGWLDLLVLNPRRYVLRRQNVTRPWRLPWAAAAYLYAVIRAGLAAGRKGAREAGKAGPGGVS